jgi:periplasmic divalent cation tolerance protein
MNEILVLTTTDSSELAQEIACALVESHEAACVNIISGIRSIYRWEGSLFDEREYLLLIKSSKEKFDAIRATILLLHSYEVPEIIAVPITAGDSNYLAWLQSSVSSQ